MGQDRIKRRVTRIKVGTQLGLDGFDAEPGLEARQVAQGRMAIRFEDPDPRDIRFGTLTFVRWGSVMPWRCGRS